MPSLRICKFVSQVQPNTELSGGPTAFPLLPRLIKKASAVLNSTDVSLTAFMASSLFLCFSTSSGDGQLHSSRIRVIACCFDAFGGSRLRDLVRGGEESI